MKAVFFFTISVLLGCMVVGCRGIKPPSGVQPTYEIIEVTGYCDCGECCGWERSWWRLGTPVYNYGAKKGQPKQVGITSTGVQTRHGTAAVDPRRYPYGTVFYVPGYGYAKGEDAGGAIKGAHIDLWFPSHEAALKWGRKKLKVKVWKVK
ncbi:MAG: 3D domain-containing protein [bacterium]|nr:3D domain-containing protein [bacterium]